LANERPTMIAPPGGDWRAFLLARLDAATQTLMKECGTLSSCTFGRRKPVAIRHPLSRAVPFLSRWLDMPVRELAGDHHMPRVQDGAFGASERFAVSPGREDQGYLELPGGISGHPLSPFYRSGFDDWADGKPTPFLPGIAAHKLTLKP
ncbi:MAG: penicillin acylase family protein, partial [Steroidobacteraceae bacterium]|nr:penicillin acylase family protein [Steroidobacteraceae bacterium]